MTNYELIGLILVLACVFVMLLIIAWEIDRFNKRQRYFDRKIETLNRGMSIVDNRLTQAASALTALGNPGQPKDIRYLVCHTTLFVYGKTPGFLPGKALTKGNKYAITKEDDESFTISNDMGHEHEFYKDASVDGHAYTEWFDGDVEQ